MLVGSRRFSLPHLYLAPLSGVTPLEFRRDLWRQKTRRIAISGGIKISPVGSLDWSQSTRVTDGQTDIQTNRITTPKTALAYLRRAVKTNAWIRHCADLRMQL